MTQNQDWGFAGDAGNFAGSEFVEHEIADDADCLFWKCGDDIEQAREVYGRILRGFVVFVRRLLSCFSTWTQEISAVVNRSTMRRAETYHSALEGSNQLRLGSQGAS